MGVGSGNRGSSKKKLLICVCITVVMLMGFRYAAGRSTTVAAANSVANGEANTIANASLAADAGLKESLPLLSSLGQVATIRNPAPSWS